ncbi:uncharacterized protein [Ptychodera flava]|uniref:uncharacterized protein n=1 Tax=Ptychodera flava TaxID=63121 RepID=UPI003969D001
MDKETGESSPLIKQKLSKLAWKLADKARFHAVSHHVSADWYERLDRYTTYTSYFLGACSIVGSGSLLTETFKDKDPSYKRGAVIISVAANVIQAMITSLNDSSYAPKRVSEEHRKAAVELQDFRGRLDFFRVKIDDGRMSVEMLQEEYSRFLEEKKNIEGGFIKSENWTFPQVHQEISGSDKRREKANDPTA